MPHEPRPIAFFGCDGHTKHYGIGDPDPTHVAAVRARARLDAPGFTIAHRGVSAALSIVYWWANENELHAAFYVAPLDAPVDFVGGFAAMDWVTAGDYRAASPDPLADAGPGIMDHMNKDHADALVAYARHFAREAADEATMIAVDRLGFRLRLRSGDRLHAVRIAFPREIRSAAESRTVLIEMLAQARSAS